MTTTYLPEWIAQPVHLHLGEMVGIEMQRHYATGFLLRRGLSRVDQYPQIGIIHPPLLYVSIPPSTCLHLLRPYVVDLGEAHMTQRQRYAHDAWRYDWYTHCKTVALRVSGDDPQVLLAGCRVQLYDHIADWYRLCTKCATREDKV
jgi:hypothetical protein